MRIWMNTFRTACTYSLQPERTVHDLYVNEPVSLLRAMAERALFLAPHGDDAHIAAGGTIVRFSEAKVEVFVATFSNAAESVPPEFPHDSVDRELRAACAELSIPDRNLLVEDYRVRRFQESRQGILDKMVEWRRELAPRWVFTTSTADIHQDHAVIATEAVRAFRRGSSVYGYDMPWNVLSAGPLSLFVELSDAHLERKARALSQFKSQQGKPNNCATPGYARSLAAVRGNQIEVPYAEAFEVICEVRRVGHELL